MTRTSGSKALGREVRSTETVNATQLPSTNLPTRGEGRNANRKRSYMLNSQVPASPVPGDALEHQAVNHRLRIAVSVDPESHAGIPARNPTPVLRASGLAQPRRPGRNIATCLERIAQRSERIPSYEGMGGKKEGLSY